MAADLRGQPLWTQKCPLLAEPKTGIFDGKKHLIFGNPAIPVGPVALRPRVAPGLPLSESYI